MDKEVPHQERQKCQPGSGSGPGQLSDSGVPQLRACMESQSLLQNGLCPFLLNEEPPDVSRSVSGFSSGENPEGCIRTVKGLRMVTGLSRRAIFVPERLQTRELGSPCSWIPQKAWGFLNICCYQIHSRRLVRLESDVRGRVVWQQQQQTYLFRKKGEQASYPGHSLESTAPHRYAQMSVS